LTGHLHRDAMKVLWRYQAGLQEVRQLQAGRALRRQRKMGRVERALHTREKNSRKGLKHALNTR
jgi:hypothetical protein